MAKLPVQIAIFSKIRYQDRLLFTKHLDVMLKAGIPIAEALETLVEQTKSSNFKKVLAGVLGDVRNGQSLAKSMKKHPEAFDEFYTSLIGVGEESGTMEENLSFLAKQLAKDYRLRKKIQGAMLYPGLVFSTTIILGGFIAFFILPKLVDFFAAFEVELPLTTKILLFAANISKSYGVFILIGLVIILFVFNLLIKIPKIKNIWHKAILRFPVIGNLIAYAQVARFSRNFGTLIKSGVPVSKSLEITADTLSNLKFKGDLMEVSKSLTKGKNIGETLSKKKYSEYPAIVSKMVSVGEQAGKLDETLLYLGDFYEDEIDDISKNLSTVIEPILLITIGLVVGFVALAIISPIYELTGSIRVRR